MSARRADRWSPRRRVEAGPPRRWTCRETSAAQPAGRPPRRRLPSGELGGEPTSCSCNAAPRRCVTTAVCAPAARFGAESAPAWGPASAPRRGHGRRRNRRQATAATDIDHPGDATPGRLDQDAGIIDQRLDLLERPCPGEIDTSVPLEKQVRVLLNFWAHNLTILTCRSTSSPA